MVQWPSHGLAASFVTVHLVRVELSNVGVGGTFFVSRLQNSTFVTRVSVVRYSDLVVNWALDPLPLSELSSKPLYASSTKEIIEYDGK